MTDSNWITIDAKGQSFGRLATQIALKLQGKDQPNYEPHLKQAPNIIVVNCAQLKVGLRRSLAPYYSHSGYLGNMKEEPFTKRPNSERLLNAVNHMLPKTKSRSQIIKHLRCFETEEHPHKAQTDHE